jgi:hypothetical protein
MQGTELVVHGSLVVRARDRRDRRASAGLTISSKPLGFQELDRGHRKVSADKPGADPRLPRLARGRVGKKWEQRVRKHFDFLLDHGFAFGGVDDRSFWQTDATYLSERVGIEIADSRETNRVEIDLIRLREGRLPDPQIWVTDEPISRTLLDNVIEARSHPSLGELPTLSSRGVDEQIATWARLLKDAAPELLRGDDAPIADAEALVRRRVAEHPQEMVVWLPHDSSDEDEREAVADAERDTPERVIVRVRRYHR